MKWYVFVFADLFEYIDSPLWVFRFDKESAPIFSGNDRIGLNIGLTSHFSQIFSADRPTDLLKNTTFQIGLDSGFLCLQKILYGIRFQILDFFKNLKSDGISDSHI